MENKKNIRIIRKIKEKKASQQLVSGETIGLFLVVLVLVAALLVTVFYFPSVESFFSNLLGFGQDTGKIEPKNPIGILLDCEYTNKEGKEEKYLCIHKFKEDGTKEEPFAFVNPLAINGKRITLMDWCKGTIIGNLVHESEKEYPVIGFFNPDVTKKIITDCLTLYKQAEPSQKAQQIVSDFNNAIIYGNIKSGTKIYKQ